MDPLFLIHFAATWFMAGLVWFVQLVHYPLFEYVSEDHFINYHNEHQKRTTWVVAPVMILELGTGLKIMMSHAETSPQELHPLFLAAFSLLGVIWLTTAFYFVPLHSKLNRGKDISQISKLCKAHSLRTFLWTLRGLLLLIMVVWS